MTGTLSMTGNYLAYIHHFHNHMYAHTYMYTDLLRGERELYYRLQRTCTQGRQLNAHMYTGLLLHTCIQTYHMAKETSEKKKKKK